MQDHAGPLQIPQDQDHHVAALTHVRVDELARAWRVSEVYIRRLIATGKLPVTRFGRATRVPVAEARRFALEHRT